MIDTKPMVFLECPGAIVPPRKLLDRPIHLAKRVDKTPLLHVIYRRTLRKRKMNASLPRPGIPNILRLRCDIKVTAKKHLFRHAVILVEKCSQPLYPVELELKLIAVEALPVRDVDIDDPNAIYRRGDEPLLRFLVVIGQAFYHVRGLVLRNYRDAVI